MTLDTTINHVFGSTVWRMQIDEETDMLFTELRDTASKQVSFAGISLATGLLSFNKLIMPERWLTGIETAHHGVLLLHGFQSEVMPVHKGLYGVDETNGNILWTDYHLTFEGISPDGTYVADGRIQPKKLFLINTQTGLRIDTDIPQSVNYPDTLIMLPQMLRADQLPAHLLPLRAEGNMAHYLRHNGFEIVSLHALNRDSLTQYLYIWNDNHKLIFEDIINDGIQKLQPEAFMNYKNQIIWLKNQVELKVLNL